jgi:membrane-associated PAP2 superfamily phosphatase
MKTIEQERMLLMVLWALLIALFGLWPELDLHFTGLFYSPEAGFTARKLEWVVAFDSAVPWAGRALLLGALTGIVWSWWQGRMRHAALDNIRSYALPTNSRHTWRWSAALVLTLMLGLGAVVHSVFKDNWGRSRPEAVQAFGGPVQFTGPLVPTNSCQRNCSFVSGHAGTGFALMAVGILGSKVRRRRWLLVGTVCGLTIGMVRIIFGKHFLSDILFCWAMMWTVVMLVRWAWLGLTLLQMRRKRAINLNKSQLDGASP